ncbi:MAG: succinate dehydrogenase, hydrophobic membrane anchor protein [Alphaproteobacteria bacterium]|nr:succinate dehydrogenase, hydrophobic membrane anchor protein [Alphaproteobacteria bacterium]
MSMKSELGKVRGLGAAHDGTQHFWMQRVTAVANVPLVLYLLYFIIAHLGASRGAVLASVKNPFSAVALALAMISICWHMKLGLQMVIEDYVHGTATKLVTLLLNAFFAYGLAALGLYAILKMNFGV